MRRYGDISELTEVSVRATGDNSKITLRSTGSPGGDINVELPTSGAILVGRDTTETLTNKTLTSPVINTPTGIVKGDVGLGNVDNTSDATKNAASVSLTNKTITDGSNNISASVLTSGTLPDARLSGTALDSISPMNTNGDIIYRSGGVATRLGHPGVGGQVLTTFGVDGFSWTSPLVNPMDAAGEIIYGGASGAATALEAGTTNEVLVSNGTGAPQWSTIGTDSIANGAVTDVKITGTITGSKVEAAGTGTPGIVSTGTQSFAGEKTFTSPVIFAESSGVAFTANGKTGGFAGVIQGKDGGVNSGLLINAGSGSGDAALWVRDSSGTNQLMYVRGDGNTGFRTTIPLDTIHLGSGGIRFPVGSNSLDAFESGTYAPSTSNSSNVSSFGSSAFSYYRIGDMVTVFGQILITQTSTGVQTAFDLTLPVARSTNFASNSDCAGTAVIPDNGHETSMACRPTSGTTNKTTIQGMCIGAATIAPLYVHFSYSLV